MATDEERAAIMAEYMNQVNEENDGEEEEEEEFQGDYFDDDDDDDGSDLYGEEEDEDDEDDDNKKQEDNYAILQGNLFFNEEGKLVYSGTWSMKNQIANVVGDHDKTSLSSKDKDKKKKKKTKFKLKSKRVLKTSNGSASSPSSNNNEFNLSNPLSAEGKPRSILFDGFFTTDETDTIEPYRKIKERDVELTFSVYRGDDCNGKKFLVHGKGCNDFGTFKIDGVFDPSMKSTSSNGDNEKKEEGESTETYPLSCSKKYGGMEFDTKGSKKRRRGYDSEDDYDFGDDGDEGADMNEIIGLHEEADMSVEELRKRYYGNEEDKKDLASKRMKNGLYGIDDDEDDDDGCGF